MRYRRKAPVEARQLTEDADWGEIARWAGASENYCNRAWVPVGTWLVKDNGFYFCPPDIFDQTYEPC